MLEVLKRVGAINPEKLLEKPLEGFATRVVFFV
jgi:hypothetical protein